MRYTRPEVTESLITEIKQMICGNPGWGRSKISVELCKAWGWKGPLGYKDISCRDLLRDLDKAGLIELPPPLNANRSNRGAEKVEHLSHCTDPVDADLRSLMPLRFELAQTKEELGILKSYISQYHYLGYGRRVGENMNYMVKSSGGIPLACMMFGAAAWKCRARDEFIGWDDAQRRAGLPLITNNVRNLIFPWVRVPHLASHILGVISRRIRGDWKAKYGHGIALLETFVERGRFRGVCYRASNWVNVGETTGRGRNSTSIRPTLPIKDVWLYPLCADFRDRLNSAPDEWAHI